MSEHTYNTDHGHFLLKKENIPKAVEALLSYIHEEYEDKPTENDIYNVLRFLGFECSFNDEGDVIDIYLGDSSFNEEEQDLLTEVLGPFVEDGSYLVFAFGGASGCWALAFEKDGQGKEDGVRGFSCDLTTVLNHDMLEMLKALEATSPEIYKKMLAKYWSEFPRNEFMKEEG